MDVMDDTITVVWAEDGELTRSLYVERIASHGVRVIGEANDLASTLEVVRRCDPDVAILDVMMPPTKTDEGIAAAIALRREGLRTAFLVVSGNVDAATASRLLDACAGGVGYLLKDNLRHIDEVVTALDDLRRGGVRIDPEVVGRLLSRHRSSRVLDGLTPTEFRVLAKLAEGLSNKGIGAALFMGERTVESHVTRVFDHLGLAAEPAVHRRVKAAIAYLRALQ